MRPLLVALLAVLSACESAAPDGTLGLPTPRPTPAATSAAPRTASPAPSASPTDRGSASPSPSQVASGSPTPSATRTATATPSATASPSPSPARDTTRPAVVAASATQVTLTVVYSEPMRSGLTCGAAGPALGPFGAIDNQQNGQAIHYDSSDPAYDETLVSATEARISGDCTTVTFVFGSAAPAGRFTITVGFVQDLAGNTIDPARAQVSVTIADEGRPQAVRAEATGDTIVVTFTEPMLRIGDGGGVTMAGNYRLDGRTLPDPVITCVDQGCRAVRIRLRAGAIVAGRTYELRIANVVDRAGRNITPDPRTLGFGR